jgi:hypothetical protein
MTNSAQGKFEFGPNSAEGAEYESQGQATKERRPWLSTYSEGKA